MPSGGRSLLKDRFSDVCALHTMGQGFPSETQERERNTEMAQAAWEKLRELIRDEVNRMVLLDAINIALRYDYLDLDDVLLFLAEEKPPMTHVVLTGRSAKPELIDLADLVSEMQEIKHPFRSQGVKAQPGVEF